MFDAAPDEDVHSFVERELVDADRRRRPAPAYRPLAQRAGVGRFPAVPAPAHSGGAAGDREARRRAGASGRRRRRRATMPSYTHMRRAQPVLVAHAWLAHAAAFRRDVDRFDVARAEADLMPLGSGAIAGTAYDIDSAFWPTGSAFRASPPTASTRPAIATSSPRFFTRASMAMVHLSRLAEDVILFSSEEFGFVEIDDSVATGSSLMPQKKNPDPLELVRGKSGKAIGLLAGWLATMKSLPIGYNKDMQEDKAVAFEAEDMVIGCARTTATVVRTLGAPSEVAQRGGVGPAAGDRSRGFSGRRRACRSGPRTK